MLIPKRTIRLYDDFFDSFFKDFEDMQRRAMNPESQKREQAINIDNYLTDEARLVIRNAAQIATNQFGRKEIDTEHLLYALLNNETAKKAITSKVKEDDIKGFIDYNAPKDTHKNLQQLAVAPRVKSILDGALKIALQAGHSYVGPEHLLLALTQEEDGLGGDILRKNGLSADDLAKHFFKKNSAKDLGGNKKSDTPILDEYSRDLSEEAKNGKLDPVIGRAEEIETTIEIVSRRSKNNPVLIGEPGVGKTAIVEGLAQRVVSGDVPETLQNKRVVELDVNALIAGTQYRGEFEERIKNLIKEIKEHKDNLIIFIDELHTIVGAGSTSGEGGLSISNVMKPALSRGELHLIGATTLNEYQKHIEKDAALERRFQPVFVSEPTAEQALEILRGLRSKYEAHHKVKITDEALEAAVDLSTRYIQNRFLPDKAIDLVDQAASRVRIKSMSKTKEMEEINSDLMKLSREREYAEAHKNDDKAKEMNKKIEQLNERKSEIESKWKVKKGSSSPEVDIKNIAEIISKMTGIPVSELTQEEKEKLLKMEELFKERIISQEEAIEAVSNAVRVSRAGLNAPNRPLATFMFIGPTGVGKTEMVKALSWMVFGSEDAITRIDMSEYMEKHAVARLIGAPPGYIGYDEGGQLTEKIRRRPYSVILLDEIEKAHPDVFNILLQVFDEGRLTDGKGRSVDFTNTIIIATSNLGSDLIQKNHQAPAKEKKDYPKLKNELLNVLRGFFRPEFLNRVDDIIMFKSLSKKDIKKIVSLQLDRLAQTAAGQDIHLNFDESVIEYLAEIGYMPEYGARELKRKIKTEIENNLARAMLKGDIKEGQKVQVKYDKKSKKISFI